MGQGHRRAIKRLAQEQAAELLGSDIDHTRRIRSAEGARYAFSELETPGFRDAVQVVPVEVPPVSQDQPTQVLD